MSPVAVVVALSAVVSLATAVLAWRRRGLARSATPLAVGLVAAAAWAGAAAAMHAGLPTAVQDRLVLVQYAGITGVVLCYRLFVDAVTGHRGRPRRVAALAVEPVLLLSLLVADPWLHLVHAEVTYVGDPAVRTPVPGPAFWAHTVYSYAVLAWSAADLVRLRRSATGPLRRQTTTMLLAMAAPVAFNAVSISVPAPYLPVDITPPAFVVTGVLFTVAVVRHELLRLVPVARSLVVDTVTDAVLVVDAADRVVDLNPAARALHPGADGEVVGVPLAEVAGPVLAAAVGDDEGETVVALEDGRSLDVRTRWIRDERGDLVGRVVVARDVTGVLAQQRALEDANAQLRAHVETIDRLRADLAEEAARDPLTGLRNRRRFVDDLAGRLTAALAAGQPLSLVLLDVDHFKAVNDTHGHAAGDAVLVAVAGELRRHARAEDVVRYGGEEFVVLLPRLDAAAAAERADELRRACAGLDVRAGTGGEAVEVTVSAGVATAPEHGGTPDELLLAADRALYAAKAGGRDRVASAG
ncbi:GGDEF domain-containing protein [Kineococcus terrestris]|uniref:GGDEF domain-containing protein n=1 Tax=Kineococcus terrestris TaxID=2044856 RepID=UPI0034DAF2BE